MIGPEGDFSESELENAKLADFQFLSLGENRQRISDQNSPLG